jgi:hypothetical protein
MPTNPSTNHLDKAWLHVLLWETTAVEKWSPNMLERKPTYIGILLFGFLSFLWLTCKALSLFGDLNLATKLVLQAYSSGGSSWVLDSGCTNRMTGERSMFSSYTLKMDSNENIVFGDNSKGMWLVSVSCYNPWAFNYKCFTCWFVKLQFVVYFSIVWDGLQLFLYG